MFGEIIVMFVIVTAIPLYGLVSLTEGWSGWAALVPRTVAVVPDAPDTVKASLSHCGMTLRTGTELHSQIAG